MAASESFQKEKVALGSEAEDKELQRGIWAVLFISWISLAFPTLECRVWFLLREMILFLKILILFVVQINDLFKTLTRKS